MDFGFTLKPDHPLDRVVRLAKLAERSGFAYGWVFDSHVLWKEPYVLLALMAQNTSRLRLGTCVTNPATREPSVTASTLAVLQELSGGRMDLGIGRGDSARRVLGKPPTTLAVLEEATNVIRDLCEGRAVTYEGTALTMEWVPRHKLPVWIAGYGPKALELTGKTVAVMVAAPAHVGPKAQVRDRLRWFPALVSNHVIDLVKRYGEQGLPADLTAYVRDRPGYDYRHHAESGSSNAAFVDDESVDRFCVTGEPQEHIAKLRQLAALGVRQFNIYLMSGDEERILEVYGEKIIPAVRSVPAASLA
ncbi:MAG: LLM class flavin-dependent oxidoreductase [Chloroflexi bacterium]|nr:MAG: LLM class flavin-dependent oxidoreductase [Chloroflexota bacterium]